MNVMMMSCTTLYRHVYTIRSIKIELVLDPQGMYALVLSFGMAKVSTRNHHTRYDRIIIILQKMTLARVLILCYVCVKGHVSIATHLLPLHCQCNNALVTRASKCLMRVYQPWNTRVYEARGVLPSVCLDPTRWSLRYIYPST